MQQKKLLPDMRTYMQPWIAGRLKDVIFILLPPFLSLLVIFIFPAYFKDNNSMPEAGWVILILLIDVAHVYTTLYKTYFDPLAWRKQNSLLMSVPFFCLIAGIIVYSISAMLFWRLLAYTAVFHFVRQQYGFMRIYSRKEPKNTLASNLDVFVIYYATLYPLLYWHLHANRNFNWFIEGDFFIFKADLLLKISGQLYIAVIIVFIIKEIIQCRKNRFLNLPKLAIIAGTMLSWYFGIVYFNGDMAFTLLNVVSHGIPYMALIWFYGKKRYTANYPSRFLRTVFSRYGVIIFIGLVFLFAFIEEGLWDLTYWKEHKNLFFGSNTWNITVSDKALTLVVPLLALPQITHYVLDGFIWKLTNNLPHQQQLTTNESTDLTAILK